MGHAGQLSIHMGETVKYYVMHKKGCIVKFFLFVRLAVY